MNPALQSGDRERRTKKERIKCKERSVVPYEKEKEKSTAEEKGDRGEGERKIEGAREQG